MSSLGTERVLHVHHWNESLFSFRTTRDPGLRFRNGHFVMLGLPVEGRPLLRAYSVASANHEEHLEFFSIKVPDGPLTSRLQHLQPGDEVYVGRKPVGSLVLDDLRPGRRLFMLATGTGLAPFMSMLDALGERDDKRDVILLHGVSYDHDLAWRDELQALADGDYPLRYTATVSRPQQCPDWSGLTGRAEAVVEGQMDELGITAENTTLYLCGNPDMVSAIEEIATARGFAPEQVRKELYWPKGREH
jgi:ferredoxin--NADP+ reductase